MKVIEAMRNGSQIEIIKPVPPRKYFLWEGELKEDMFIVCDFDDIDVTAFVEQLCQERYIYNTEGKDKLNKKLLSFIEKRVLNIFRKIPKGSKFTLDEREDYGWHNSNLDRFYCDGINKMDFKNFESKFLTNVTKKEVRNEDN